MKDGVRPFDPKDSRVVFVSDEEPDIAMRSRRVSFWPPGYSKDTKLAVVRVVFPWSIHHGEGTYLLCERNGKWVTLLRQFVYYP